MTNLKVIFTPARLRLIFWPLFLVAAVLAVLGAISSSGAIGQRARGPTSPQDGHWYRVDVLGTAGPTPTPPSCPGCWQPSAQSENFDGVTPPALPPDWVATNAQGPPPLWVTSDSGLPTPPADTAPNALFIDDPAVVSDKRLDGWFLDFFEDCCVRLTFRHNFNLEASDVDPNVGFDGGVLELSTDGGNTFQDILAAGGSFGMGGYNRTIATDRGSPIAGRPAWSGNSNGFITTVVDVPAIQKFGRLRWRMASDMSGGNEGWRVDTLHMTWCKGMGPPCTPTPSPPPSCEIIQNNGFESGSFAPWVIQDINPMPVISTAQHYSGIYSAHIGSFPGNETPGDSSFYQTIIVPAGGGTLFFWFWPRTADSITSDWQDIYVTDTSGNVLATILHTCTNTQGWTTTGFDMSPFAGMTVRIKFLVHEDNGGNPTDMFVDEVSLRAPGPCPSVTPTPTVTPTVTPTATATATPTATLTPTPTSTATPTPTGTASPRVTPRPRPTPMPRPTAP